MTAQEMFDRVAKHLLTQNKRAFSGSICMYKTEDGLKCAIGCLIPDDKYTPSMEGVSIGSYDDKYISPKTRMILKAAGITKDLRYLASELQNLHDNSDPIDWPRNLELLAKKNNLQFPKDL